MKLWKDMTACEKGALLLAYHEGQTIEHRYCGNTHWGWSTKEDDSVGLAWYDDYYYRVKRKPVVIEVVRYGQVSNGGSSSWGGGFLYSMIKDREDTHKITFNLVDGEPDCNSIKMIRIKE